MKIHMTTFHNPRAYYSEASGVLQVQRALRKNPKKRVTPRLRRITAHFIVGLLLAAVAILALCLEGPSSETAPYWFLLGILFILLLVDGGYLISFHKLIKRHNKSEHDAYLTINEQEITLDNTVLKTTVTLPWDKVQYVVVTKNTVVFLTQTEKGTAAGSNIICDGSYRDEIIHAVTGLGRGNLILYKL